MDKAFRFAIETVASLKDIHTFNPPVFHRDMVIFLENSMKFHLNFIEIIEFIGNKRLPY